MITKADLQRVADVIKPKREVKNLWLHESGDLDWRYEGRLYTKTLEYGEAWELHERLGKFLRARSKKRQ